LNESGMEHGNKLIRELNGVKYFIDSGTNAESIISTLNAYNRRIILLTAGYDKDVVTDSLCETLLQKVRHLILVGRTASLIEIAVLKIMSGKYRNIDLRITKCSTLQQGVDCAYLSARPDDIVLLSPVSFDYDMFSDFEECKNQYQEYVMNL